MSSQNFQMLLHLRFLLCHLPRVTSAPCDLCPVFKAQLESVEEEHKPKPRTDSRAHQVWALWVYFLQNQTNPSLSQFPQATCPSAGRLHLMLIYWRAREVLSSSVGLSCQTREWMR